MLILGISASSVSRAFRAVQETRLRPAARLQLQTLPDQTECRRHPLLSHAHRELRGHAQKRLRQVAATGRTAVIQ